MSIRIIRFQADRFLGAGSSLFPFTQLLIAKSQIVECFGHVGPETDNLMPAIHRFAQPSLLLKGNAQTVQCFGVIGLDSQCLLPARYRLGKPALQSQGQGQVVLPLGVRPKLKPLAKAHFRRLEVAAFAVGISEFVVSFGIARSKLHNSMITIDGGFKIAAFAMRVRQMVVRLGKFGFEFDGGLPVGRRLRHFILLLQGKGQAIVQRLRAVGLRGVRAG